MESAPDTRDELVIEIGGGLVDFPSGGGKGGVGRGSVAVGSWEPLLLVGVPTCADPTLDVVWETLARSRSVVDVGGALVESTSDTRDDLVAETGGGLVDFPSGSGVDV